MQAKIKPTLTFPNDIVDAAQSFESGPNNRYHKFLTKDFASSNDFKQYTQDTGLSDSGVKQSWGTGNSHSVFRSRRA